MVDPIRWMRSCGVLVLAVTGLVTVGACTPADSDEVEHNSDGALSYYLEQAREDDSVGAEQVSILELAVDEGEISFEVYQSAVSRSLECMEDAGVVVRGPEVDKSQGYPRLSYSFLAGAASDGSPDNPVPDACILQHSRYVAAAYEEQPASREAQDEVLELKRPDLIACADDRGLPLDHELPTRDLLLELLQLGDEGRECIQEAGVTQF